VLESDDTKIGRNLAEKARLLLESKYGGKYQIFSFDTYFIGLCADEDEIAQYLRFNESRIWVGVGKIDEKRSDQTFMDCVQIAAQSGGDFYEQLRGHFCVARINLHSKILEVAANRFGTVPMFWGEGDGVLLWAPDIQACMLAPGVDRSFDQIALAEGFLFDNIFLDRTPFVGIRHLPSGTVAICERGKRTRLKKYWYGRLWGRHKRSQSGLLAEGFAVAEEAIRSRIGDAKTVTIFLSGGLDSRVILGVAQGVVNIETWTHGAPGCWDLRSGRKLADLVGSIHSEFVFRPHHYVEMNEPMVFLSGGMSHAGHFHLGATARHFKIPERVVLSGLLGGPIFGCFSNPVKKPHHAAEDEVERYMVEEGFLTREELELLCEPDIWGEVRKDLQVLMTECLAENSPSDLPEYIGITQRQSKLLIFTDRLVGCYHDVRLPYTHYGLAEFCLSLPPEWRYDRKFEQLLIKESFPELAKVMVPEIGTEPLPSKIRKGLGKARIKSWRLWQLAVELVSGGRYSTTNPLQKETHSVLFRQDLRTWLNEAIDILEEKEILTREASNYFRKYFFRGRYDLPRFRVVALEKLCHLVDRTPQV
jgi:asparagine synthetase B (glutamine-hydrolysing)